MVPAERVEALRRKHALLAEEVERESKNAYVNDKYIKMLKRQKLTIKEMIEGMSDTSVELKRAS
jgi:hypothetical protein